MYLADSQIRTLNHIVANFGHTHRVLAYSLDMHPVQLYAQLQHLYHKVGVKNQTELVLWWIDYNEDTEAQQFIEELRNKGVGTLTKREWQVIDAICIDNMSIGEAANYLDCMTYTLKRTLTHIYRKLIIMYDTGALQDWYNGTL